MNIPPIKITGTDVCIDGELAAIKAAEKKKQEDDDE